jgi:deoxyribodipyrimidine photo-lyase
VRRILIWYRNDLRLHDHEPLFQALKQNVLIIPFYCLDPRQFATTQFGFAKTGSFRAQFLFESLADLRRSLQQRRSNLVIRQGRPEVVLPQFATAMAIDAVYYHREVTAEECQVEQALQKTLQAQGIKVQSFWGSTLYHLEDLPVQGDPGQTRASPHIPELFTRFRKQVEQKSTVRDTFPCPEQLPPLPELDPGDLPTLGELGLAHPEPDARSALRFEGGETAGRARLQSYIWQQDCLKAYKQTRNGMLGANDSSKFSPWLALGCLSPRLIHGHVKRYEAERVKNDSTYWLIFELIWRDFFRFIAQKHGTQIFQKSGLLRVDVPWKQDWQRFERWQAGQTGFPLVDANMRELAATGFMSNRGRQNVASFLTKNLGIDWRMGAEWFESLLIDYDVCSNYGNWNYTAGVGNDARGFRYFNIPKQSRNYDPQGDYLRRWLPELKAVPGDRIHEPWQLTATEQKQWQVQLGVDYPGPIVDFFKSLQAHETAYLAAAQAAGV